MAQASIVYTVDQNAGAGSIKGSITTNGHLGSIGAADVLDWSLELKDGVGSFTLNSLNSQVFGASSWLASNTALSFDFDGSAIALFQHPFIGSGQHFWCLDARYGGCGIDTYSASSWRVDGVNSVSQYQGVQAIATAVPEPGGYALLLAGLGLLSAAAGRKKTRGPKAARV
nr:PEP-CTERM sorting domain-containing protein [Rugamonas sp. CCM 8940]